MGVATVRLERRKPVVGLQMLEGKYFASRHEAGSKFAAVDLEVHLPPQWLEAVNMVQLRNGVNKCVIPDVKC